MKVSGSIYIYIYIYVCFELGDDNYHNGIIYLHSFWVDAPEFAVNVDLRICFRVEFQKIQLTFATDQYPAPP